MPRWIAAFCLCLGIAVASAQEVDAGKADALYQQGKRLEALPMYEALVKTHPKEWVYEEHLAACLSAKAEQTSDPAEIRALRIRMRDAAKSAVDLGDPNYFVKLTMNMDLDPPADPIAASPGATLQHEGEKAFAAGDYATALAKYSEAASADPTLYQAALYAGDTAYSMKDLPTAAKWFARAIAIDPDREVAYRYWGDAMMRIGHDPLGAEPKYIDAIVAEPYNKLAWQGIQQWAKAQGVTLASPRIDRPAPPIVDQNKPNNINIQISPEDLDDKKNPGGSAWMMYSLTRASYHGDTFKKDFPNENVYRHTLKEESAALSLVATALKENKINPKKLNESLRNVSELNEAGMIDCWILINAADEGIAQDYAAYRSDHRQLLHDYLDRFVVHGDPKP